MTRLFTLFLFIPLLSFAQAYQNISPPENIKTVQLFNPQSNDLTPIIAMNERLIFSFDDMNKGFKSYAYKIERYDRNWEESSLFYSQYVSGYESNIIRDYTNSFNTLVNYTHYEVVIPNRDIQFKLSGNYSITVYEQYSDVPVVRKRFAIFNEMADVGVSVERLNTPNELNQRVEVRVASGQVDLTQNPQFTKVVLMKNNNWKETLGLKDPVFSNPSMLTYNQLTNNFAGGNEYRFFDTKNIQVPGLTTERAVRDSIYHTVLFADAFNPLSPYIDNPDVNGNYYIRNILIPNELNANSEGDYSMVYFALADYKPEPGDKVCVYGAFNDFRCTPESIMHYNPNSNLLEAEMLLKQGYYNYSYALLRSDGTIDYTAIPGSYWQTENQYSAMVYYRPWGQRYDLLIGYGEGYSRPSLRN